MKYIYKLILILGIISSAHAMRAENEGSFTRKRVTTPTTPECNLPSSFNVFLETKYPGVLDNLAHNHDWGSYDQTLLNLAHEHMVAQTKVPNNKTPKPRETKRKEPPQRMLSSGPSNDKNSRASPLESSIEAFEDKLFKELDSLLVKNSPSAPQKNVFQEQGQPLLKRLLSLQNASGNSITSDEGTEKFPQTAEGQISWLHALQDDNLKSLSRNVSQTTESALNSLGLNSFDFSEMLNSPWPNQTQTPVSTLSSLNFEEALGLLDQHQKSLVQRVESINSEMIPNFQMLLSQPSTKESENLRSLDSLKSLSSFQGLSSSEFRTLLQETQQSPETLFPEQAGPAESSTESYLENLDLEPVTPTTPDVSDAPDKELFTVALGEDGHYYIKIISD